MRDIGGQRTSSGTANPDSLKVFCVIKVISMSLIVGCRPG